jgi:hypothetical protein
MSWYVGAIPMPLEPRNVPDAPAGRFVGAPLVVPAQMSPVVRSGFGFPPTAEVIDVAPATEPRARRSFRMRMVGSDQDLRRATDAVVAESQVIAAV